MEQYKTILNNGEGLYEEKRSSFISYAFKCSNTDTATKILSEIRAKHRDARHVVYAYSIREENLIKSSDDGEPHGTAGKPIMDIITGNGITDVIVIVVRYFGGILLGTGGLVRAYSAAAKAAVENAGVCTMCSATLYECKCNYQQYPLLERIIDSNGGDITDTVFEDTVFVTFCVPNDKKDALINAFTEQFCGNLSVTAVKEIFFASK